MIDRTRWTLRLGALLLLLPLPLGAQSPEEGSLLTFDAMELSLGGRVQTQLNTSSIDGVAPSELLIRRARLEIGVRIDDLVSAALQPDFAGDRVSLKDAFVNLAFSPAFQARAGNIKRPFGIFDLVSSKRMPVVERGLRIRGLAAADEYGLVSGPGYSDRDLGVMVHGAPVGAPIGLGYAAGVFRGPLHGQVGAQDSYQYTARATAAPGWGLKLGAAWSSRDFSDAIGDTPDLRRGHAFEVDLEYGAFAPGFHLIAELSSGDLDPFADSGFRGGQAWLAYRTAPLGSHLAGLEPVLRLSHADADDDAPIPGGTLFTPGVNVYLTPLTRLMLNYDVWRGGDGSDDATSFKAMMQVAF
jgi:hypothetical protein